MEQMFFHLLLFLTAQRTLGQDAGFLTHLRSLHHGNVPSCPKVPLWLYYMTLIYILIYFSHISCLEVFNSLLDAKKSPMVISTISEENLKFSLSAKSPC